MKRQRPIRPAEDQLLLSLTEHPISLQALAQTFRAEDGASYSYPYVTTLAKNLRNWGLAGLEPGLGMILTLKGRLRQMKLNGESEFSFPVDFAAPAVSIMFRQMRHGWEGQVFVAGKHVVLSPCLSWSEVALLAADALQSLGAVVDEKS